MKKILLALMVIQSIFYCNAQDNPWVSYTDGHKVIDMVKDSNIIWIATSGGIVKLDISKNERTFYNESNSGLSSYLITSIAIDKEHNLWIGTSNKGLFSFDGTAWVNYTFNLILPQQAISDVEVDNLGNIWVGYKSWGEWKGIHDYVLHYGGLMKFDGYKWENYSSYLDNYSKDVYEIKKDNNNNLYISTNSLIFYNGNEWNYFHPNNDIALSVKKFTIDNNNKIWILQDTSYLLEFKEDTWKKHPLPTSLHENYFSTHTIYADSLNNIWIGSDFSNDLGLMRFDGQNWTYYNTANCGIQTNKISSLLFSNNNLYVGTDGNEINMLDSKNSWSKILTSNSPLLSNSIQAIYSDRNENLWTSSTKWNDDGQSGIFNLLKFDGNQWEIYDNIPNIYVKAITIDNSNNVWIAGYKGVAKYDGTSWLVFNKDNTNFPNNLINAITIDNDNLIWIAGGSSYEAFIAKYDGLSWTVFRPTSVPYEFNKIVVDKNNNKWIAGFDGLFKFDGANWEFFYKINDPYYDYYHVFNLKFNSRTNCLWFSSSIGLIKYDFNNFYSITNSETEACGIDNNNNVWSSVSHFDTLQCFTHDGALIKNFTSNSLGSPWISPARDICIMKNGYVYLATDEGLVLYKNGSIVNIDDVYLNISNNIQVSPNPCVDYFRINSNNNQIEHSNLKIFDLNGKIVKTIIDYNKNEIINISDLRKGTYILQISNNLESSNIKIIKQ